MRRSPPDHFERIQQEAQGHWELLEAKPKLAGPWRQLFRQVQDPRHVLSELLQNADDAGATWASAEVKGGGFVFRHDGHDFTEQELESLCSFGTSNKQRLLTIGFRGIGFRSTFSLGPTVQVVTPGLACQFHKRRFTEPVWTEAEPVTDGTTTVQVQLDGPEKEQAIRLEIERWGKSPVPLLFFRTIRRLRLADREVQLELRRDGPCPRSTWVRLSGFDKEVLVVRSAEAPFPPECVAEIQEERGVEDLTLPPCEVVLVSGVPIPRGVYVVLPTEVVLPLPFSCQAPFIQDPARTKIKDPASSPTNRWLLGRIGRLLGIGLAGWLGRRDIDLSSRARAYGLLPERLNASDGSLADTAARLIVEAFKGEIEGKDILLCSDGTLESGDHVGALPDAVLDAWDPDTARKLFCPSKAKVLAHEVAASAVTKLSGWGLVEPTSSDIILKRLRDEQDLRPPRPQPLERLVPLWSFLESQVGKRHVWRDWWTCAAVIPASDRGWLGRASEMLAARARPEGCTEDDWAFLLERVDILDTGWSRLVDDIGSNREAARERVENATGLRLNDEQLSAVTDAFGRTKLRQRTRSGQIIERAARRIFTGGEPLAEDAVRLLRIACRMDAALEGRERGAFRFLCRDGRWRTPDVGLVVPGAFDLDRLLPSSWRDEHVLSGAYEDGLNSEEVSAWRRWGCDSNKGGLNPFALPEQQQKAILSFDRLADLCCGRGGVTPQLKIKSERFRIDDWDWPEAFWDQWKRMAAEHDGIWCEIAWSVLRSWTEEWKIRLTATAYQEGYSQGHELGTGPLRSAWVEKLRNLPCVRDTSGRPQLPSTLLRLTEDTSALREVEPFVKREWDRPEYQEALDPLGVRSHPTGVSGLLGRLGALSETDSPPLGALLDLYRAVDRVASRMAPHETQEVVDAFQERPLVFTDMGWRQSQFAFKDNPDGVPGVAVIHRELRKIDGLWNRLEIRYEPTADDALIWLGSINEGEGVSENDLQGIRGVLRKYPRQAWTGAACWLDMQAHVRHTREFKWACRDQDVVRGLFAGTKGETADLTMLGRDSIQSLIDVLPPLLERRLQRRVITAILAYSDQAQENERWLQTLGRTLARIRRDAAPDEESLVADKRTGQRLAQTRWVAATSLKVQMVLDGTPAGRQVDVPVAWDDEKLYVCGGAAARYRELAKEMSRHFRAAIAQEAVRACVGRSPSWIGEYAESHLDLGPESASVEHLLGVPGGGDELTQDHAAPTPDLSDDQTNGEGAPSGEEDVAPADRTLPDDRTEPQTRLTPDRMEPVPRPSTSRERLIAYLEGMGFVWDWAVRAFVHPNGRQVRRREGLFQWELVMRGVAFPIWVAPTALDGPRGLEIPTEVWETGRTTNALLLEPQGDSFRCREFRTLHESVEKGSVEVFPALYRLRPKSTET